MNPKRYILVIMLFLPVLAHAEVDWSSIPAKKVPLFYPGMTSWEFLVGKSHDSGGNAVARGEKACQDCHIKGEKLDLYADDIIIGKLRIGDMDVAFEPEPLKGMPGFKDAEVQAAYDATEIYLRFRWPSPFGASFKDPTLYEKGLSDRIAIQLNGNLKSFNKNGCFMACHSDNAYMYDAPSDADVSGVTYYEKLNRKDVRLYAYFTRSNGWATFKPEKDMDKYLKAGGFIDLWVAGFKGKEVVTSDESIFYDRIRDLPQDLTAQGVWQDGFYIMIIKRKLTTLDQMDIQLQEGKSFTMGIAVYDNKNGNRKHYVSFPLTVALGTGPADINAVKKVDVPPQVK